MVNKVNKKKEIDVKEILEAFPRFLKTAEESYSIEPQYYEHYNVKRGLRNADGSGVLVGLTKIGEVHGYIMDEGERNPVEGSLRYRGVDVSDIVAACQKEKRHGFEEVTYLILFGRLPDSKELELFKKYMCSLRRLPQNFTEDMILKAPSSDIMNKLARSVLASYSYDENPDDISLANILRQSFELIARFPTMVAHAYQAKAHYFDGKSLILHAPKPGLSTAENFLHMMRADNQYEPIEAGILDLTLILHAEHGGGNNSAFATHVVSSTGTDTYSAIAAAIGSLKGPRHGGANAKVMGMIEDFKSNISDITDEIQIRDHIIKILNKQSYDKSGLVYGIGHAVYTLSDPRAVILEREAQKLAEAKGMVDEFNLYRTIAQLTPDLFAEIKHDDKVIAPNVDFYSGFVYKMLNIPPEVYTPIFAISRITGWCAHRIEEILVASRIIRPAYKSVAKREQYIPLNER
ncbi:MAG: citrate/2-methylcitrate synthase [Clostridia bacterium]|nr:citrate/2-methylcitrate synthase [Clostridia bacterium]